MPKTKTKVKSKTKLKKDLWKVFSEYVRRKNADWRGYVSCVSCGVQQMWNDRMDAGHWIHDKLDFDERNVHPQCKNCNLKFNWKKATVGYATYMARTYGYEIMEEIKKLAYEKGNDYTITELELMLEEYKQKLSKLTH